MVLDPNKPENGPLSVVQQELIETYLVKWNVMKVAWSRHPAQMRIALSRGYTDEEIESELYEGLIRAAQKYRPVNEKCATFSTYANWWILSVMTRIARPHNRPTFISGDSNRDGDREKSVWLYIVDPSSGPSGTTGSGQERALIAKCLSRLPERDARIIRLRFGIDTGDGMSLDGIAGILGITKERVRQIQNRSLSKIKKLIDGELYGCDKSGSGSIRSPEAVYQ